MVGPKPKELCPLATSYCVEFSASDKDHSALMSQHVVRLKQLKSESDAGTLRIQNHVVVLSPPFSEEFLSGKDRIVVQIHKLALACGVKHRLCVSPMGF